MSEQYWLDEEAGLLTTQSEDDLLLNSGPRTTSVSTGDDFTVSDLPSGICQPSDITQLEKDYSWLGHGLVSLDGAPAINASLQIEARVEASPIASLVLGARPKQWAWRVTGWSLELSVSDLTPQIMALATQGGLICINAQVKNQASSQLLAINITATAVITPSESLSVLSKSSSFESTVLVGQIIGAPTITQELAI